jgi:AcrR family transcriptional regulator
VAEGRRAQAIREARLLLAEEGAISMRRLADRLGIKAPSLYKHFPDKAGLEAALITEGFTELAAALEGAGDGLPELLEAYRRWALEHPHLYDLATRQPLRRDLLPEGVEEAAGRPVVVAAGGDPDRARALWASAHGLIVLEQAERFPPDADLDAAWRALAQAFATTS